MRSPTMPAGRMTKTFGTEVDAKLWIEEMTSMDPTANWAQQLELAEEIQSAWDHCAEDGTLSATTQRDIAEKAGRLAELVEALNGWIIKGGYLPPQWGR